MSKLGVGVGEDFPVDEDKKNEGAPVDEAAGPCGCGPRSDQREAWRHWRHHMRAEWRAHRRAMYDRIHRGDQSDDGTVAPHAHVHHLVIGALALVGLAALLGHHRGRN